MTFDINSATTPEEYGEELRRHLREDRPDTIPSPMGDHGVTYGEDDQGEYATIGQTLPEGVFAEIEDGTFGQLQGYRVYLTTEAVA